MTSAGHTTTDENGNYYFGGLNLDDGVGAAGADYRTRVATSNFAAGACWGHEQHLRRRRRGASEHQNTVTMTPAAPINLAQDFSYTGTTGSLGTIGNRVWQDLNANGIYGRRGRVGRSPV